MQKSRFRTLVENILKEYSHEANIKADEVVNQIINDLTNAGYPKFWIKSLIKSFHNNIDRYLATVLEYQPDFEIPKEFKSLDEVSAFYKNITDLSKKLKDETKDGYFLDDDTYNDISSTFSKHHQKFNTLKQNLTNDLNKENTDSEGTPIQNPDEVQKFMQGSVAVDKFGRPLALYIGTETPVNQQFDFKHRRADSYSKQNAIFATKRKDVADEYRTNWYDGEKIQLPNTLNKVYMNLKNPLVVDFRGATFNRLNLQYVDKEDIPTGTDIQGNFIRNFPGSQGIPAMNQAVMYAKRKGYDGVIAKSVNDFIRVNPSDSDLPYGNDEYIAFNPNQIMIVNRE